MVYTLTLVLLYSTFKKVIKVQYH